MDDLDTVGKYGTISLIRKNTLEAITSYPVDDERTTFGRDPKCSIRMYFHAVEPLHCSLYFDDGKAYLEVHGSDGVTVDDVLVPSGSTVPLNNASKFMIWRKLFSFNYPPREIRSKLMTSPRKANSKSLRMSMIHSAVILTPRANTRTQTLDLRTLQSPIKPYKEAPNEIVTFVDSDQIAVVEDNCAPPATTGGFLEAEEQQDRSLVALEEIDYDENTVEDPLFSRTPIKRVPAGNPFAFSQQQPSTPFRALTPTLHRRTSTHAQVPPLSSVKSPVPTFLPPSASPSAPRLLSPGRPLQSSSLVPRDQWRQAVVTGFTPQAPRTPPRRKQARMSMHKAVLVRSAHRVMMATAKEREEKEEEDEVEEVVSPERKATAADFGSTGEEAGDDDAEGEDDFEMRDGHERESNEELDERPESGPAPGVLRAGANLFSSLSTFVRKSLSPERRSANGEARAGVFDHEPEDGEITDQPSTSALISQPGSTDDSNSTVKEQPHPRPGLVFNFNSNAREGLKPVGSNPSLPPQRSPVRPAVRFNFAPFQVLGTTREEIAQKEEETAKSTEEDITDAELLAKSAHPIARQDSNPFYTPQATRVLPLQTNTVARPQASAFDGEMPKLNTFWSKPIRPRKSVDPSTSFSQSLMQATPSKPLVQEQTLEDEIKVGDDENAKRERELRAQRRKSLLAAMDATPRHLADPSTRRSVGLAGASKRREGSLVPGSPSKKLQPDSLPEIDHNLALGQSHAAVGPEPTLVDLVEFKSEQAEELTARLLFEEESDVSSAFEEAIEPVADALDMLKANVARARRESAVRAARLSHGGGLLDASAHSPTPLDVFNSQSTADGAETQPLDLAGLLSTGHVELQGRETSSSDATPTSEEGLEVDITEAQAEVPEVQAYVTKELNLTEEMKQETVDVEEEPSRTSRATKRTPSPFKRDAAEPSATRTTRGTKRSAAGEAEFSVKRSTRRRVQETQDEESPDLPVEEAPRPLRRGRSATPAAQNSLDDAEPAAPTPSTRTTRRAASETPRSASRSPSKSRSARGKLPAEPVIEEEALVDDTEPVGKTTVAPKPSKIAKSKAVLVRPPSRAEEQEPSVRRVAKAKGANPTSSTTTSTRPGRATNTNPTAGNSTRVAGVVPRIRTNSTATTSAIPSKRTAGEKERQTGGNIGTRVKRSTQPDPDQGVDDDEDSNPRKRRKAAATVKEEEADEALVPSGSLTRKTSASRLPSALPTANRRAPTSTKRTPSNRKGSADHDKENTPETVQPEDQAIGKASAGKAKSAKIPAVTTRSRPVTTASKQNELVAHSGGRSLRERPKK